jgi:glycosyltransferase involved in cell wall biosynthesis
VRILLLVRALGFGGAERQVVDLAHGLARRGHDVGVAAFYPGAAFDRTIRGPNPELIVIGKRGRWDAIGFLWRLIRSVDAWRPDVVYSFLPVPNLAAALCRARFRRRPALVWGLRGTPLELERYDWLERASIHLERMASRLPDLVIANSQRGAAWARGAGFAARRVAMIRNGIDTNRFRPATPAERVAARAALGCKEAAFVVAVVARLDPMKDHPTFLAALAIALQTAPSLTGLIVGDGLPSVAAGLKAKAAGLGIADAVIWVAARDRASEIYHAADVLCLPSAFGEGFPNVVGEAMACGLTCIVTAVGDSAAVVGDTGCVVSPGSPALLARAILDCMKPIRESPPVNLAARQRIVENFGLDTMISATESSLSQVVAGRRRRDVESGSC